MNLLFLNDPIVELHPYAWAAALASECAGEQGRFGEYHDVLFSHQPSLGLESWMAYASQAKVSDMAKFDECVKSKRMRARLEREQRTAYDLGITNTPTFVVDGQMYNGTEAQLDSAVRAALAVR
jgi:protein-disulfide isomerase